MKNLIFINGTMGAGKTAVCQELKKLITPSIFLDGDWCLDMEPLILTEETKTMAVDNICYLLENFIECSECRNIIFCWVMHEQSIVDSILKRLNLCGINFRLFTLMISEQALRARLGKDVSSGIRKSDIIERSVARLPLYNKMNSTKIDVSHISAADAAARIAAEMLYII